MGISAQIYRYRRASGPVERQQTKWVFFGFAVALASYVGIILLFSSVLPVPQPGSVADLVAGTLFYCSTLFIPVFIGIAIMRYRLWDIDVIINRAFVYVALTAAVISLYVLIVEGLGALLRTPGNLLASLLATGAVAVIFAPLRDKLQRWVNRMIYGERDDPYGVLSGLGRRLKATLDPEYVLPTIVETVAGALKLPYAAIAMKRQGRFEVAAVHGSPTGEEAVLPLTYGGETVGRLILAPRATDESFGPADRRLLEDLARSAEVAVQAVRLTDDLRSSRERLVTAREEERRRLRRDLHDGLGPTLGSLALGLDVSIKLLRSSPDEAETILAQLKEQAQESVADIRRLVYGLRPPALDDLGLVAAIRAQAAKHGRLQEGSPCGEGKQGGWASEPILCVEAPENLPPLPAAVEVACYRIAQEALTNVARHARARNCRVSVAVDDARRELRLEVRDDGAGLPQDRSVGVGLTSMRERASELGGAFGVSSMPGGGTRVVACLPLFSPEEEGE